MLHHYSVNLAGPSHVRDGIVCQDSLAVGAVRGGSMVVACVADGLGSESHSDQGSAVASQVAMDHVASALEALDAAPGIDDSLEPLMREAYYAAYDAVIARAAEMDEPVGEFDCTLCMAVFDGETLWWGQSGDSGLVCAHADGSYELVTRMQRDDEGRVFPLCFSDHWEFGVTREVRSLMLMTDGVLQNVAPPVLAGLGRMPVDTRLAHMFLHPEEEDAQNLSQVEVEARAFWQAYPESLLDDDKTVVVVFDDEHLPGDMGEDYYAGPDWDEVGALVRSALYPAPKAPAGVECGTTTEHEAGRARETSPKRGAATACEVAPKRETTAARGVASKREATATCAAVPDCAAVPVRDATPDAPSAVDVAVRGAAAVVACGAALGAAAAVLVRDAVRGETPLSPARDDRHPHRRQDAPRH